MEVIVNLQSVRMKVSDDFNEWDEEVQERHIQSRLFCQEVTPSLESIEIDE